jgi:thioredoxin 1
MAENVMEFSDDNFEIEVLNADCPVLVDFWAEWCGPCKALAPTISTIADEFKDKVRVGKVNVDFNSVTASKFGVRSIPTLLIFHNGAVVNQIVGNVPKESITKLLNEVI